MLGVWGRTKLQALVYDILLESTTALFSYAIGSRKLSANEQFSVGAQTVVSFAVAGQLRGDSECPFSGVTKSGRVWRKVPESDARSQTPSIVFTTFFLQPLPYLVTP